VLNTRRRRALACAGATAALCGVMAPGALAGPLNAGGPVDLLMEHDGMADRSIQQVQASQAQMDAHIQSVAAAGPAAEIERAKSLLDSGAIDQAEFDQLKAKALA